MKKNNAMPWTGNNRLKGKQLRKKKDFVCCTCPFFNKGSNFSNAFFSKHGFMTLALLVLIPSF